MTHTRDLFDLSGRTALVTGGSRGLGLQMARALGELGARLVITARNEGELAQARAALAADGIECHAIAHDLVRFERIASLVDEALARLGAIDILVNNAGTIWSAPAEDHSDAGWNKVMRLNSDALFFLTREVARRTMLPRRRGSVLNVASLAGLGGFPPAWKAGYISYNASKAAVIGITKALATEWGAHGIRVNAICPGLFPSAMADDIDPLGRQDAMAATPLQRFGGPDDLKGVTAFLCSDASLYVTGQSLAVDGGMSAAF